MFLTTEQLTEMLGSALTAELCLQVEYRSTRNPVKRYRIRRELRSLAQRIKFLERMVFQPAGRY